MPEYVSCDLCGGQDSTPLFILRDYRLMVNDRRWQAVRCAACGLGYLNPRPTPAELEAYYPPRYFAHRRDQRDRYERQARYVTAPPGRLLDIGAAQGEFLEVMRSRGWDVEGVEAATTAGNPYGLSIHRLAFPEEASILCDSRYDVITAWATFEHLRHPGAAFRACATLLQPTGRLIVQVPNLRSIAARYAMQEDVPRHLYFFSAPTLAAYGQKAGLRLTRLVHTTDLFGGSGRGVLRLLLTRALGGDLDTFFDIWRKSRRRRFQERPVFTVLWMATAAIESVILADPVVRTLRISGQIVAEFEPDPRSHRFAAVAGDGTPSRNLSNGGHRGGSD